MAEGAGTEQDAFAEFLLAFHAAAAFNTADTVVGLDRRITQGTTDSDGDGFSNAMEVAALGLNPDQANTAAQINAALAGSARPAVPMWSPVPVPTTFTRPARFRICAALATCWFKRLETP